MTIAVGFCLGAGEVVPAFLEARPVGGLVDAFLRSRYWGERDNNAHRRHMHRTSANKQLGRLGQVEGDR
jgi:hypothetical protein